VPSMILNFFILTRLDEDVISFSFIWLLSVQWVDPRQYWFDFWW